MHDQLEPGLSLTTIIPDNNNQFPHCWPQRRPMTITYPIPNHDLVLPLSPTQMTTTIPFSNYDYHHDSISHTLNTATMLTPTVITWTTWSQYRWPMLMPPTTLSPLSLTMMTDVGQRPSIPPDSPKHRGMVMGQGETIRWQGMAGHQVRWWGCHKWWAWELGRSSTSTVLVLNFEIDWYMMHILEWV